MKKNLPLIISPFLLTATASAATLAYEGFDSSVYSGSSALSGQGTGSGSGFTGEWKNPAAPLNVGRVSNYWSATGGASSASNFLNASSGQSSYIDGNSAALPTSTGQATYQNAFTDSTANQVSLHRSFNPGNGANTPSSFYVSTVVTIDGSSAVSLGFISDGLGSSFGSDDRPFQFGFTEGGNLFAQAWATDGHSLATSATAYSPGTYLLVARIRDDSFKNDNITLWLNPDLDALGSSDLYLDGTTRVGATDKSNFYVGSNTAYQIQGIVLDFKSSGTVAGSTSADEIRIGNTYADVVPEPATALLGALGTLVLLLRKRVN